MKRNFKVLIIDDDPDDQDFLIEALREINESIEFSIANNGYEALDLLEQANSLPDYILLDLNMPAMGGLQFLQSRKPHLIWSRIPTAVLTTSISYEHQAQTRELGVDRFIFKPIRVSILKKELETVFGRFNK